jgi:hypothetical protein
MLAAVAVQPLNQAVVVAQADQVAEEQAQQVALLHQLALVVLLEHQILAAEAVQALNL